MKRIWIRVISLSCFIIFSVLFLLSLIYRDSLSILITGNLKTYGLLALFLASAILDGFPQYIAPQLLAFNAALLGFGFFETILALYIGSAVGSIIAFEIGKGVKKKVAHAFFKEKTIKRFEGWINRRGAWVILLSSVSPLPYIPAMFGVLHVQRRIFLLLGVLPRFAFFVVMALIAYAVF